MKSVKCLIQDKPSPVVVCMGSFVSGYCLSHVQVGPHVLPICYFPLLQEFFGCSGLNIIIGTKQNSIETYMHASTSQWFTWSPYSKT